MPNYKKFHQFRGLNVSFILEWKAKYSVSQLRHILYVSQVKAAFALSEVWNSRGDEIDERAKNAKENFMQNGCICFKFLEFSTIPGDIPIFSFG